MPEPHGPATLVVEGVSKRYGSTLAVNDASFTVGRGELIGIAGHNGAGKSTILKVVNGAVAGDGGSVTVDGVRRAAGTTVAHPERIGVRTVYQELSLCDSLRVEETAAVFDRSAKGFGWRNVAWRNLKAVLDDMFPDHGIRRDARIRDLSLARRQMIECASAMLESSVPPSLVILDEPTSSLDATATATFYAYLKRRAADGLSAIVTTHRLNEMIDNLSRIYVMRDGRVLGEHDARTATKESLVRAMGLAAHQTEHTHSAAAPMDEAAAPTTPRAERSGAAVVDIEQQDAPDGLAVLAIHRGEIVGFAGLEGHGQLEVLETILAASKRSHHGSKGRKRIPAQSVSVVGDAAYVSGDRGVRGIFPQWDGGKNVTFSSLKDLTIAGVIRPGAERRMVRTWWDRLAIKGTAADPITSLSGGTQQKALMARAIAQEADLLLLEDPTRGVDQATKDDVYALLRRQADAGQCVVWYSTENEELRNCDRVFVFQGGTIVATLEDAAPTEDEILALSFASASTDAAQAPGQGAMVGRP